MPFKSIRSFLSILGKYGNSKQIGTKRHRSEEKNEGETSRRGREKRIKEESDEESTSRRGREKRIKQESKEESMENTLSSQQQELFHILLLDYRTGKLDKQLQYCRDYSTSYFWCRLTLEFNKRAQENNLDTITELEFHSYGTKLERTFLRQKKKGKHFIDPELGAIFSSCMGCRDNIPVFINNALDSFKPSRSRSRSRSRSQSQSQSGAQNLTPSAESASVEMANSRLNLVKRIKDVAAKDVITMDQMVKLIGKFDNWEENLCSITLLLTAADDMEFTAFLRAILNGMD